MPLMTYRRLMAGPSDADLFDRHVFACAIAIATAQPARSVPDGLGLSIGMMNEMGRRYFPNAPELAGESVDGSPPQGLEEPDLRALLLGHATTASPETQWLAHIIARRAMEPNHLWQDLGLTHRGDLGRLMQRHFAPLAALNDRDMKWKKFFYRQLCGQEGIAICKSPVCDLCSDVKECFGTEDGASLLSPLVA